MFDRLLVDPDDDNLVVTLREAGQRAGMAADRHARRPLANILDEMESNIEGLLQLEQRESERDDPRYLCVAWWTDYRGIRHVRVCGGNLAEGKHLHYCRTDEDSRPPLWHVYPEHNYRVQRSKRETVWLASCSCGATGPPKSLGWMGPCCGPCHDRHQDGETLPGAARRTILDEQDGPICSLAFSPDGNTLAVSSAGRLLYLHDLRDGSSEWLYSSSTDYNEEEELWPLLFSPDGRFLATGEHDVWSARIWRLEQSDSNSVELFTNNSQVEALAFSPDGGRFAAVTSGQELFVWQHLGGEWHEQTHGQDELVYSVDFSPDGKTLALGSSSGEVYLDFFPNDNTRELRGSSSKVIIIDFPSWKVVNRLVPKTARGEDVLYLHYTPSGTRLVVVTGATEALPKKESEVWTLRLWDLTTQREQDWARIPVVSALAASPDGRYLAWIVHDRHFSPAEVTIWDIDDWREAGWLEWNTEDDLRELAFSPDGETLAIGTATGVVKLVPWRMLLEG